MHRGRMEWRFDCPRCGLLRAEIAAGGATEHGSIAVDETERAAALGELRRHNFARILDALEAARAPRGQLLDVGCAHGWFLDAAARRGYEVHGIEPDARVGAAAQARGHDVMTGYFPAALPAGQRYDVIAFNDVFEHLPQPRDALAAVRDALTPGGVLVLNLPSSDGVFYRTAEMLRRIGVRGPHDRLWQLGFPSPHLSYFRPEALTRLAAREGFVEIHRSALDSFTRAGLWERLRGDGKTAVSFAAIAWLGIVAASPLLRRAPADISLHLFRASAAGPSEGGSSASAGVIASAKPQASGGQRP